MKSIFQVFLLALSLLVFSGCFDILEDISMNPDGSGNATFKVDLSQSKQELTNYMKVGEVNNVKLPDKTAINEQLDKLRAAFTAEKGISQVTLLRDYDNFVFTFKCRFSDLNAFNAAINRVTKKMADFPAVVPKMTHFSSANGRFFRHFDYPMKGVKKYDDMSFTERFLLETAKYTCIYRFPRPVTSQSNATAELSGTKKAVKIETPLSGFVKGEVSLRNEISY